MRKLIATAALLLSAASTYAGGYRVALQGQKQLAMGHTGVAVVNSSEVAFFNPAGMSFLNEKFNFSLGVHPIISHISFQNETYGWSAQSENPIATPFSAYAVMQLNEWASLGLAVYTPYGSGVEYPTDWVGSHLINNISLAAIFVQPTLSVKLTDNFSIGGGPIYVSGNVDFNRNLDRSTTNTEGERLNVTIKQDGISAWGYTLGMMFKPTQDLTLGVNYRSEIIMDAEGGEADFQNIPSGLEGQFADGTFNASLPLPAELTVGASMQLGEKWLVAFDYNRVFWSAYENLDVVFSNGLESINPRNYQNSSVYRFGAQYKANDRLTLRGGYYFDESPVQAGYFAPETPRNDSNNFTTGLSYRLGERFTIDASFLYIHFDQVDASYDYYVESGIQAPFGGTYKNNAFIPGLGVSYAF